VHKTRVADYIAEFFASKGVDTAFVVTGSGSIRLIQGLSNYGIKYVCTHHEQAAVISALAYMRVSRKPALVVVTGGPGACNTFIGLADAFLDSLPLFVLAGQENLEFMSNKNNLRGKGVQGIDMVSATKNITKFSHSLTDVSELKFVLEKAFLEAYSGRPGPVWVEIPQNLQSAVVVDNFPEFQAFKPNAKPNLEEKLIKVIELINDSKRPLFLVGHGIRLAGAESLLKLLLSRMSIPALVSWQAADLVPNDHPLYVGRSGVYGQRFANLALQNCDLLITLGSRIAIPQRGFKDEYFARAAKKVIVDIDISEIKKFKFDIDVDIEANVYDFIEQFLELCDTSKVKPNWAEWKKEIENWQSKYPMVSNEIRKNSNGVNSYVFIEKLSKYLTPSHVIVTDMGTSLTCTHAAIQLKDGQRLITSTGLGEMGYGLPGAIGAAIGGAGRPVVLIVGEGGFMFNIQELQTLKHLNLNIKIFLLNNNGYLTIRHTHKALYPNEIIAPATGVNSGISFPNFKKISRSFGFKYLKIKSNHNLSRKIRKALKFKKTIVTEISMPEFQELTPKIVLRLKPDGSFIDTPLEDLYPFISRDQLKNEMRIPLIE
jgi:acetolactate synthase-1/2/3 large subunit